jgi:glutamyl-tRNA reductase
MTLLAIGASHRTAPLSVLERLALTPAAAARMLAEVGSHDAIREAAVLCTCNRAELYLISAEASQAERVALASLSRAADVPPAALGGRLRSLRGPDAVRHLFRVTAGLESVAVGETEIQGQVKRAYERALLEGATGPIVNRLFRGALAAGKRVRAEAGGPRPSVASVAVGFASRRLGRLEGRRVLVLGAGENADLIARALVPLGARIVFVAGRRYERAAALARRFGGRAVELHGLGEELARADAAFGCTSSAHPIVGRGEVAAALARRQGRPLLLIDVAVPRDVEPGVGSLPGVTLLDMDDLGRQAAGSAATAVRAGPLIDREVERFQAWLETLDVVPAISTLREHADAAVERALDESEGAWESLSARDRERVGLLARAVASRLLHEPTMRLRRAAGSDASSAYIRAVRDLFELEEAVAPPRAVTQREG